MQLRMQSTETQRHVFQSLRIAAICLAFLGATVKAQEPPVQQLTAPPPPKVISRDEREQIDASKDSKARIKLILTLAENHLLAAEQFTSHPNFEAASGEVGKYHALIDEALKFAASQPHDSNRTRDLYKRIELALRAQGPRLTSMRRTTPLEFAVWIKEVEEFARKGRTEALDSFYGHTVLREPAKMPASDKPLDQSRKDNSLAPPNKQP